MEQPGRRRLRLPLPLRRDGVRLTAWPAPATSAPVTQWFLDEDELGNPARRIRPWSEGNDVAPLVDGRRYFAMLADALEDAGPGDLVLFTDWRGDPEERLRDDGPTISESLASAAQRGARVKGLVWRSHLDRLRFSSDQNRDLTMRVNEAGGEALLDQRVRPLGSHHQKSVVIRHPDDPGRDVAFLGGIDLAHSRRDDSRHRGDPQPLSFPDRYGATPAWHDVHVSVRGPAVRDVEDVFRERWDDPEALTRLPWHAIPDMLRRLDRDASDLAEALPEPPAAGPCAVQLLRTYPNRWPGYPFAPDGERSVARAYAKALRRARRLVYVEDQYLWSSDVARVFAEALRREPGLHLVVVVPRFPDRDAALARRGSALGHAHAMEVLRRAGGHRVWVYDLENHAGQPVYVHAKVCIVDDVWATVGSDNFNRRSWTHDSELTAAVLDDTRDGREPLDPAGLGDGARRFARGLRLRLLREHLDQDTDDGLLDPDEAVASMQQSAGDLERWHRHGCAGPRPRGRLRLHRVDPPPRWQDVMLAPFYRAVVDPDGRPPRMKLRGWH